ncbi:MAG TPA: hypothetical protein VF723_13205 [Pyrinomonadaceae bacterium]|jgi:hypothetical protein
MNDAEDQVYELIRRALGLEEGDEQIAVLEEAVRLADLAGDIKLRYFAREQFIRAAVFGGATDKALVAFSWCLSQFDADPEKFSQWAILWKYKWIVGLACNLPQISKAKIYEMLDDLAERSRRAGYGLRAVYNQRYSIEKFWDNREEAVKYFRKMEEMPEDALSNCSACELDDYVGFAIYEGDDERAVELAGPILDGHERCASVPHRTYANLLLPLVRLDRLPEAMLYHQRGYALIANNKAFLDRISNHLIFLVLTENFRRAIALFEKHYPWSEQNSDLLYRFRFYRAAWLLFQLLSERGENALELRLPRTFPLYAEEGRYDAARLAEWFRQGASVLAARFDARNENDFFARTLAETPDLKRLTVPFPLGEAGA